jgi:hypothetical protein
MPLPQTGASLCNLPPSPGWRGLRRNMKKLRIARQQKPSVKNLVNFYYFTGIGVAGDTGTAVTAFIGLPSMSLSE